MSRGRCSHLELRHVVVSASTEDWIGPRVHPHSSLTAPCRLVAWVGRACAWLHSEELLHFEEVGGLLFRLIHCLGHRASVDIRVCHSAGPSVALRGIQHLFAQIFVRITDVLHPHFLLESGNLSVEVAQDGPHWGAWSQRRTVGEGLVSVRWVNRRCRHFLGTSARPCVTQLA